MKDTQTGITGLLEPYFETGTEGVLWAIIDDKKKGYDSLNILKKGDMLAVFADAKRETVLWQGVVDLEYERNKHPHPLNPNYVQQAVGGYWVHGLQKTLEPEVWADMFFKQRPATLFPAPK